MRNLIAALLITFPLLGQTTYLGGGGSSSGVPGEGTVTSVAVSAPAQITVSGSPITSNGTIALTWAAATQNTIFAGPGSGGSGTPLFRALVSADLPATITGLTSVSSTSFTGALTGNASTATALAANPADCSANQFATAIAASGALTCAGIVDADVPNTITVNLAATATALASNPTDCGAGEFANAIDASGNLTCDEPASGGISSLNGLTGATQTFAVGTAGTDVAITSSSTTHTFDFPSASATARGLVTTAAQSFAGRKTFDGQVSGGSGSSASNVAFGFNGTANYGWFNSSTIGLSIGGTAVFGINLSTGNTTVGSEKVYGWSSGTDPDVQTMLDLGVSRVAAGVMGVGTGGAAAVDGSVRATWFEQVVGANVASATTITLTGGIQHVTGTTAITTINLPRVGYTGCAKLIPDDIWTLGTGGNIAAAATAVVDRIMDVCYDGSLWYPSY